MKILLPLIGLLLLIQLSKAQTHEPQFKLISGADGINLGKINGITRDIHGAIWLTDQTNRSLTRYDGTHMIRYSNELKNPNSLGGTYPESIASDSAGIIWIGFYGMGLDRFDPETGEFTHFRHQPDDATTIASDSVSALLIDHLGNLWIGNNGGLDLFDPKTGTFKHHPHHKDDTTSLSHNVVRSIYEDKSGELWVGTGMPWDSHNKGGLNRFHRNTGTFTRYMSNPDNPHALINNKVRAIFEDSKGNFWVGTAGDGLHIMDRKTGLFTRHTYDPKNPHKLSRLPIKSAEDHITFITEDVLGTIWIGTWRNGAIRYDPETNSLEHYGGDSENGFKDYTLWWSHISKDGLFLIATQEDNLYQVDLFTNIIQEQNINGAGVYAFFQDDPSVIWYGTYDGLVRKDRVKGTTKVFKNDPANPKSISNNFIEDIQKDNKGKLWVFTAGGVNLFDPDSEEFTRYLHNENNNQRLISNITNFGYFDSQSNLWIGTISGLDKMDPTNNSFIHYQHDPTDSSTISNNFVTSMIEDKPGDFWVSTWNGGGVNRLDGKTGKFKHYLNETNINSLYKDKDNVIWAGGLIGLYRYDRKSDKFTMITYDNVGLEISQIATIIGDDKNNLWISSFSGIYKINAPRTEVIHYGKECGIPSQSLNYAASYQTLNGQLLFGTFSGYLAIDAEKLKVSQLVPSIQLSNFWVNNKAIKSNQQNIFQGSIYSTKEFFLENEQDVFSFGFSAIDYSISTSRMVLFKLDGYDPEWRHLGSESRTYYFNVPPGRYVFRIKAMNSSNGGWQEKKVNVFIAPPWWQSWWAYTFFGLAFIASIYSVHRFQKSRVIRAERERSRAKELQQAKEIEKAYHELKVTQSQLIQSEKMASLGELTAGIAHEIQNPLNFVNNFSEVNSELIAEMKEEIAKGNFEEVNTIANHIDENEKKIIFHGMRADAIVKSMLQHSRSTSNKKEPTDINALADEYLRLAYHGLRAKDKSFNATIKTDLDESMDKINVVPQDIGRAILNLITNAFYVVTEKKASASRDYEPTVTVSTKRKTDTIEIIVSDNGNGIPKAIVDKIFQPFFTTKPTGKGTGLGLSLSYDIITKGHEGQIKVESQEGVGTSFILILPLK